MWQKKTALTPDDSAQSRIDGDDGVRDSRLRSMKGGQKLNRMITTKRKSRQRQHTRGTNSPAASGKYRWPYTKQTRMRIYGYAHIESEPDITEPRRRQIEQRHQALSSALKQYRRLKARCFVCLMPELYNICHI